MGRADPDHVVVGRLRNGPVLVFLALSVLLSAWAIWQTGWGGGFADSMFHHIFGELLGPLVILMGLVATFWFARMWAGRSSYLHHDRSRLYRGSEASWPLASIRGVSVTRNGMGLRSVRIRLSTGSQPELAKAWMLIEDPERVRAAIAQALQVQR